MIDPPRANTSLQLEDTKPANGSKMKVFSLVNVNLELKYKYAHYKLKNENYKTIFQKGSQHLAVIFTHSRYVYSALTSVIYTNLE